jgi:hypothetical protein
VCDPREAAVGPEQGQDSQQRRLSGAVGPQQGEHRAPLDGEADPGQRLRRPEPLRHSLDPDHRRDGKATSRASAFSTSTCGSRVQQARQIPAADVEQAEHAGQDDRAHDGRVEQQRDGELAMSDAGEDDADDRRRAGDDPRRGGDA